MSSIRNSVQLVGFLGKDPEIRTFESGKKLGHVSIATSNVYKDDNGNYQQQTHWHNLVGWGAKADYMEKYLQKGSHVGIMGSLTNRTYIGKDGETKYRTEIVVNEFVPFERKERALPF